MRVKRTIISVASPLLGFLLLVLALSWLFDNIFGLQKPAEFRVTIKEEKPPEKHLPVKKPKPEPPKHSHLNPEKPVTKEANSSNPQPLKGKPSPFDNIPAISIYYDKNNTNQYLQALAKRKSLVIVKSSLGNLVGMYDPLTGNITDTIPDDLSGYSPRTRFLARYGDNPRIDRMIEKVATENSAIHIPDGCSLIVVITLKWEQELMESVAMAAGVKGIAFDKVESAAVDFVNGRFKIRDVRLVGGGVVSSGLYVE